MSEAFAVDRARWSKLSIFEQMGNIYSEVGRSFRAQQTGDSLKLDAACGRALDLFDATAETLATSNSPKLKEVLRAKESYLSALFGARTDPDELAELDRYFRQFALAARRQR